jgi:hypothetical protein
MLRDLVSFGVAALAIAGVLLLGPAADDSGDIVGVTSARADAGECKPNEVLSAARLTRADIDARQATELRNWCTRIDRLDTAPTSSTAPGTGGPGSIAAPPTNPAIWCGKQVCACWKGKYYDGCHHLSVCTGPLTCYGKICVCKTQG